MKIWKAITSCLARVRSRSQWMLRPCRDGPFGVTTSVPQLESEGQLSPCYNGSARPTEANRDALRPSIKGRFPLDDVPQLNERDQEGICVVSNSHRALEISESDLTGPRHPKDTNNDSPEVDDETPDSSDLLDSHSSYGNPIRTWLSEGLLPYHCDAPAIALSTNSIASPSSMGEGSSIHTSPPAPTYRHISAAETFQVHKGAGLIVTIDDSYCLIRLMQLLASIPATQNAHQSSFPCVAFNQAPLPPFQGQFLAPFIYPCDRIEECHEQWLVVVESVLGKAPVGHSLAYPIIPNTCYIIHLPSYPSSNRPEERSIVVRLVNILDHTNSFTHLGVEYFVLDDDEDVTITLKPIFDAQAGDHVAWEIQGQRWLVLVIDPNLAFGSRGSLAPCLSPWTSQHSSTDDDDTTLSSPSDYQSFEVDNEATRDVDASDDIVVYPRHLTTTSAPYSDGRIDPPPPPGPDQISLPSVSTDVATQPSSPALAASSDHQPRTTCANALGLTFRPDRSRTRGAPSWLDFDEDTLKSLLRSTSASTCPSNGRGAMLGPMTIRGSRQYKIESFDLGSGCVPALFRGYGPVGSRGLPFFQLGMGLSQSRTSRALFGLQPAPQHAARYRRSWARWDDDACDKLDWEHHLGYRLMEDITELAEGDEPPGAAEERGVEFPSITTPVASSISNPNLTPSPLALSLSLSGLDLG
ncbi:hypothetical protein CC2G_002660 [Coprinopsis cinerea AmutBmut pab1-1]|nr:hypothetical protein CC2G_002660 [Coprinopsis cinerea AmutBmut pab1-1]